MKQTVNVLCFLLFLWACSCQSKETEAYLENLAEENATLLELIQKKNQELDQLSAQVQQLENPLAEPSGPVAAKTRTLPSATAGGKKTDSLQGHPAKMVVAAGYPASPDKQPLPEPLTTKITDKTTTGQTKKHTQPRNVEEYLNQISDPAIELATRKEWKKNMLLTFANASVEVFAEKKGFVNRYTAATLLDLLMYFPHQVKVNKVVKDSQDKIIQLRLQMNRQKI